MTVFDDFNAREDRFALRQVDPSELPTGSWWQHPQERPFKNAFLVEFDFFEHHERIVRLVGTVGSEQWVTSCVLGIDPNRQDILTKNSVYRVLSWAIEPPAEDQLQTMIRQIIGYSKDVEWFLTLGVSNNASSGSH